MLAGRAKIRPFRTSAGSRPARPFLAEGERALPARRQRKGGSTEAITIINESRDRIRVALFKQPSSPGEPAIALRMAEVAANSRARMIAAEEDTPAELCVALVRSGEPGSALPAWAVNEAVSIGSGQTAKVSGSLSRGFQIRVK